MTPNPADHAALYRAVLAAPADDAPRGIIADWYREHGLDELAAFVGWQLAHPGAEAVRRSGNSATAWGPPDMPAPLRAWFHAHSAEVVRAFPRYAHVWRRGFVDEVGGLTSTDWLDHHAALRAAFPLRRVRLTSRLGWCGNGGPGGRPSLSGTEDDVGAPGPWNARGRRRYECVRAVTPDREEDGGPEHPEALLDVVAQEWPGVEVLMPPQTYELTNYPRRHGPAAPADEESLREQVDRLQDGLRRYLSGRGTAWANTGAVGNFR